jgi:predicted RNase H-like HicB family nuclease
MQVPEGFMRPGEDDPFNTDALSVEFGYIDGYRVIYEQGPGNWSAYSPDLPGCVSTGATREEVEQHMGEAIPFHLEGMAEDRRERPWLYTPQHARS